MEDETVAADANALEQPQEVIEINDQEEEEDEEVGWLHDWNRSSSC